MKMLIGGEWVDSDRKIEVQNPYSNEIIDLVPEADNKHVEKAINSAQKGFKLMSNLPAYKRAEILANTARLIEKNNEPLARLISQEVGKTIKEARGEVNRAVQTFTLASEEAKRIRGEIVPFDAVVSGERKMGFYLRSPVGIILAITPFNFPLNLVSHKVAPALAAGNSIILKPATKTPLSALKLGELLLEAGMPPLALNIVIGKGDTIGSVMVTDSRIRMVTFTGSAQVGKKILREAGLKKTTMELGSNSAVILMSDADLKLALPRILVGGYAVAGQVCISVQRVFVQKKLYKEFLDKFVPQVQSLKLGNPLDETTDMGPMISENAARRAEFWIKEAINQGAHASMEIKREGSFLSPNVLTEVNPKMKVFSEEAFAPFVTVSPFENLSEAINLINQSKYGLQVGIYGRNIFDIWEAIKRLEVGGVMVNEVPTFRVDHMPYGGVKESGLGREGIKYAIEEMTEIKLVCFNF